MERDKFIVVGRTEPFRTSKNISGRYKSQEELRDVHVVDRVRGNVASRLLVYRAAEGDPDALYLISFDIPKLVKRDGDLRKPSREYSAIAERMLERLCARIDNSTYLCPEDASDVPRRYTGKVEVAKVVPFNDEARRETVAALETAVDALAEEMERIKLRGRAIEKARRLAAVSVPDVLRKYVSPEVIEKLEFARERLARRLASRAGGRGPPSTR